MTNQQIRLLGPALSNYLDEFSDCFVNGETRCHLRDYVCGQLSNLPRKSVEPMADLAEVPPRTLQEFLSLSQWDEDRLRDRVQQVVARDHADPDSIGIIDESGHPKKGNQTACVQRQYCGRTGKIDNCVMSVHLSYAARDRDGPFAFRAMIDSELFLPEKTWAGDVDRRAKAQIPRSLEYRSKDQIGLELLDHALSNGIRFGWITADEWYSAKPRFIAGLETRKQRFVLEIPKNTSGALHELRDADERRSQAKNLCRYSSTMRDQSWTRYHIKDTDKGPAVWEVKSAPFWMVREEQVVGPYWLIVARDVLNPDEMKYFLSNASAGTPLTAILYVAFSRWPVERCFEDEKSELGLSHFECRKYVAVRRHMLITQVSHLFLARECQRLRGEKSGGDDLSGEDCQRCVAGSASTQRPTRSNSETRTYRRTDSANATSQRGIKTISHGGTSQKTSQIGNPSRAATKLRPAVTQVAL